MSRDLGGFKEVIRPGAFSNCLSAGREIRACIDHDPSKVLGFNTNGTAVVKEDQRGLYFETEVPDVSYARDAAELVRRGLMRGCSFGFRPRTTKDHFRKEGSQVIRELHDIDCFDVSIVYEPAYPATSISLRSFQEWQEEQKRMLDPKAVERWIQLAEMWD